MVVRHHIDGRAVFIKECLSLGEGYHAAAQPPMPRIASKLAPNEIEALASYLSFVESQT